MQSSLGGNARTAIICTMSPALSHVEQSRNTLLFATSAKEVTNSAQVNMVGNRTHIGSYHKQCILCGRSCLSILFCTLFVIANN